MKMNRNEMEALYAFGCPNLKATVERLPRIGLRLSSRGKRLKGNQV